ncbi:MAG: DUF1559 domain-containing protein [Pirellulaceae bacterium]
MLLPAVQTAREAARRSQCSSNLKQIELALHNYHDTFKSFPPAYIADANGRPMHSWRVLILPFMEQRELYDQCRFDEPWDGPNNQLHSEGGRHMLLSLGPFGNRAHDAYQLCGDHWAEYGLAWFETTDFRPSSAAPRTRSC